MGLFSKKDYSTEIGLFGETFVEARSNLCMALSTYGGNAETEHLIFPLLIIFADYAASVTKFKGKGEISKFQQKCLEELQKEGLADSCMKVKAEYRKTIGFPTNLMMDHINVEELTDGLDNMICRCAIIFTGELYNADISSDNSTASWIADNSYYTFITNLITAIVYDYYEKLCGIFHK